MALNPQIINSIENLNYRVTVGDVAAQAGLELNLAQQGLLALAADAGGHLQVAESGDIVYSFPKNFQTILRNKYWQLQLKQWWQKVWRVLFYLIRISFGIVLIASIVLMLAAIAIIIISVNSSRDGEDNQDGNYRRGGGFVFFPRFWYFPDFWWWFQPNYNPPYRQTRQQNRREEEMNFLEAVYSFLFGDGNPNISLEENRYATIGQVIRNHKGSVVAEQIAPYLDTIDSDEDFMIPVLARFNGYPEVSPEGELVYYFPELQATASQRKNQSVASYLQEQLWRFSQATSSQIMLAVGLGTVNLILALVLNSLLRDGTVAAAIGGLVGFVASIYWILLGYGIAFLSIPLLRYFWIQWRNEKIANRNQERQSRAIALENPDSSLVAKILYASKFAQEKIITNQDLAYTTETDLIDQEIANKAKIDSQWQERLSSSE